MGLNSLGDRFHAHGRTSPESLAQAGATLGINWPPDYRELILTTGGGEGWIGESYAILWPPDQLIDQNRGYGFPKYAPNLVAFGSDGGGEAFAFDRLSHPPVIVMVPFVAMDRPVLLGSTVDEFLLRLRSGNLFDGSTA